MITHRLTVQNRSIFSDPISRPKPNDKAEEISHVPTENTADGILKASHKSEDRHATLLWSQNSQKRHSYVAAISSSEINLDNISNSGKPSAMEEILLQDRSKESTRSLNGNEISTKVRNGVVNILVRVAVAVRRKFSAKKLFMSLTIFTNLFAY